VGIHESLHERHKAVLPSWLALYYDKPIALVRGDGRTVWDAEGNRYLDFFGGILTTISGYNVPEITEAIREQASRMVHSSTLYLIEPAIELAELISRLSPIRDAKVFFGCSGTEANDAALLLATSFRRSNQILTMRNSYHGRSFSSVAITGNRAWSPSSLSPVNVSYVDGGYYHRNRLKALSDDDYNRAWAEDLRYLIETTTSGDVACLIAEPIQGVGGFASPPDGFYGALKEVLDEFGILFVSDEVQTGWGRTGDHFWGIDAHGVVPDLITFAKGIGNGLSIGGVIARPEVMDSVQANSISTFGGNPLSTAGALANLRYLLDNDLQSNARKVGEHLMRQLKELQHEHSSIADVRGKGLMLGIEFVRPGTTAPAPEIAAKIIDECRERRLLVGKGGLYNSVIRFAPPLSVTLEEAEEGFRRFAQGVAAVLETRR
jgi:4-aminobutyrate aminotransferase